VSDSHTQTLRREFEHRPTPEAWEALLVAEARLGDPFALATLAQHEAMRRPDDQAAQDWLREMCSNPEHGAAYDDPLWGRMCFIPPGVSVMGSPDGEGFGCEHPQHLVYVPAYWIAQRPATLAQWKAAGGAGGSVVLDGDSVVRVSWQDVATTLEREVVAGASYRVLRGGGWVDVASYCRAANRFWGAPGDRGGDLGFRPARSAPPDGNVSDIRAIRGGSWYVDASYCRASYRSRNSPDYRYINLGFRVVLPPQDNSYRLPTEDEWERAARGWNGRRYPWGNEWVESRVERRKLTSPYGLHDMNGEVWQWCQDTYTPNRAEGCEPPPSR